MLLYRLGKNKFIKDISGEGARLFGGRWNYKGYKVLYTSESLALSILEYITKAGAVENELKNLSIAYIEIDGSASIKDITIKDLPVNWDSYPAPDELKKIGTNWLMSTESLMLRIPAVSAPDSFNILINPLHSDFKKMNLIKIREYHLDIRLKGR